MTNKDMINAIKEEWAGVAEQQIESGRYLHKVGRKYVYVLDIHGNTTIEKWPMDVFYANFIENNEFSERELSYLIDNDVVYNYKGKC